MHLPTPMPMQSKRFYDGGLPADGSTPEVPPDPDAPAQIVLTRIEVGEHESFHLDRRIAYDDVEFGELIVPPDLTTWQTDLTSVPALFTWLVPKTGAHLPAALIHDGLVWNPAKETQSYISTRGLTILRPDANRVLRNAMRDTGTGTIRRWLVWSAVATATMVTGAGTEWSTLLRWRYRLAATLTIGLIVYLGYCATADLFDRHAWGAVGLPWMGERPWPLELAGGLAGAIVVPLVVGPFWGRFRAAGWILGIGLAVLIHVTIAIAAVTLLYQALEWLVRTSAVVALALGVMVVALCLGLFVALTLGAW